MKKFDVKERYAVITRGEQRKLSRQADGAPSGTPQSTREEQVFAKFRSRAEEDFQTLHETKSTGRRRPG